MGLFLLEDAEKGDRVALYTGDVLTEAEARKSKSGYLLRISKKCVLDARDPSHDKGRYINCGVMAKRTVNVAFGAARYPNTCRETGRKYVSVRATQKIKADTELLANYGRAYWAKGGFNRSGKRPKNWKSPKAKATAGLAMISVHPHDGHARSVPPVRLVRPPTNSALTKEVSRGAAAAEARPTPNEEAREDGARGGRRGVEVGATKHKGSTKAAGGVAKYWRLRR